MIELYHYPNSTCAQKINLCLFEKELTVQRHLVDLSEFRHLEPEFLRLNPSGMVPVLVDDGRVIPESRVINEYLEERFPDRPLLPADPYARARVRLWTKFIDEVPNLAVFLPTFNTFLRPLFLRRAAEELDELAARMPDRKRAGRWPRLVRDGFPEDDIISAYEALKSTVDRMETALANGPWLAGEAYTLADVDMIPFIMRTEHLGRKDLWEKRRPRVRDWLVRVKRRPSFEQTYYALIKEPLVPQKTGAGG